MGVRLYLGEYKSSWDNLLIKGHGLSLIEESQAREYLMRINFKKNHGTILCKNTYRDVIFPKDFPVSLYEKLKLGTESKIISPLIMSDDELIRLMKFLKYGCYLAFCELDVLRDDSLVFEERWKNLQAEVENSTSDDHLEILNKKLDTYLIKGGYHGFIYQTQAARGNVDQFGKDLSKQYEVDRILDNFCGDIRWRVEKLC